MATKKPAPKADKTIAASEPVANAVTDETPPKPKLTIDQLHELFGRDSHGRRVTIAAAVASGFAAGKHGSLNEDGYAGFASHVVAATDAICAALDKE